jgi:hypothetical protein
MDERGARREAFHKAIEIAKAEQDAAEKELRYGGLSASTRERAGVRRNTARAIGARIRREMNK